MPSTGIANEIWSGNSEASATDDNYARLDYKPVRRFQLTCSADASDLDIYAASGIPGAGSAHPNAPYCFARRASVNRLSPIFAEVEVYYEGKAPSDNPAGDPTAEPAYVESFTDVDVQEEVDTDFDGIPITTANGEPVTGIKASFCDQVVTIKKNIPLGSYNNYLAASFRRRTNIDSFLGWPAGTAKIMRLGAQNVNKQYYTMTGVVQFRVPYLTTADKAWYARWRHEGFYERVIIDIGGVSYTKIQRALDDLKKPMSKKVLLDANGLRLPLVLEFANIGAFPATGDRTKAYFSVATELYYKWNGSAYTEVTEASISPMWIETKLYGTATFSDLFGSTIIY